MDKPFSQACENNKDAILKVLKPILKQVNSVLEIGSGTAQHAVHFANAMPHLSWQCADQSEYLYGINLWLAEAGLPNTPDPIFLNVNEVGHWPTQNFDAAFSANTVHIMHWVEVVKFFDGIADVIRPSGHFCLYGPFNYNGAFTSESNQRFDQWLKDDDPGKGIRDFEAINDLAGKAGLTLINDHTMPANNRLLHWQKTA